jgi:hypothetical protein
MDSSSEKDAYRFFIAGIIQGSKRDSAIHDQAYRTAVRNFLESAFPACEVYCPFEHHPDSVGYDSSKAQKVFFEHLRKIRRSHGLIVYLPEASMGSAIEMWEAYHHKTLTVSITPMTTNWVVRILSDRVFENVEVFGDFVASGGLARLLRARS